MKIDILVNDGSPLGVVSDDIYGGKDELLSRFKLKYYEQFSKRK